MEMKATGIIRRIDDLGRIVVPKEFRLKLGIREGDAFEIFYNDDMVCFKKYNARGNWAGVLNKVFAMLEDEDTSQFLSAEEKIVIKSMADFITKKLKERESERE